MKKHKSYQDLNYGEKEIAIANISKLSFNKRGSRKTYTPFGVVKLYNSKNGNRKFSISKSNKLPNRGSYTFNSLRARIKAL